MGRFSTANSCPLDHRTTAASTSIRCSFGSVTVSERVSPGRIGISPESRQPVHERFQTVPWPRKGLALYVTEHCTGKRRWGRIDKGTRGASQGPIGGRVTNWSQEPSWANGCVCLATICSLILSEVAWVTICQSCSSPAYPPRCGMSAFRVFSCPRISCSA
jgi:hypothetical protein